MTEEKPKHTPGPWWDESGVIHAKHPELWSPDNHAAEHVCSVTSDRAEADGGLIAAAPDLLAALEAMIEPWAHCDENTLRECCHPNKREQIIAARHAITKAKGGDANNDTEK